MTSRILIVDDLATQRTAAKYTLTGVGYDVTEAENGQDALQILETQDGFQLILADLTMPIMDGLSLLEIVKSEDRFQHIPVLILMTESQLARKDDIRKAGAVGWILKPYEPEQLCAVVSKLVP